MHLCCGLRRERATFFIICVRKVLVLHAVVSGKFFIFALPCAVKSEVSLCILSANYGGGFRVGSIHEFVISIVLVNAHVHVHVGSASGSHSAILNASCNGLGHHCTVSSL